MSKKIYVGNLSFKATESDVRALFEEHGVVESVAMINDRDTGRFRGFCFVEMADDDALAAIEALDGYEHDGRTLKVNEARPREERGGGGGFRSGGGGQRGGGGPRGGGSGPRGGSGQRGGGQRGGRDGGREGGGRRDDYGGGRGWG